MSSSSPRPAPDGQAMESHSDTDSGSDSGHPNTSLEHQWNDEHAEHTDGDRVVVPSGSLDNTASSSGYHYDLDKSNTETTCWVCFANPYDDPSAAWVHPCRCRGTTKWVHQACIQRWVDEKQKGNAAATVECPQCATQYIIVFPRANFVVAILDASDRLVQRVCPIIAGAVCAGSLYWSAITYGAISLMQSVGHTRGLKLLERSDPLVLIVSLPLIPVGLVLGKMIRWEDPLLEFLRKQVPKTRISSFLLPPFADPPTRQAAGATATDAMSVTRTFCGALFFPTIATFLGSAIFEAEPSQWRRTLYGGATYLVVKGVFKIYYRQKTFIRQCQRVILNYEEQTQV